MSNKNNNIHPIFDDILNHEAKEKLLNQKGIVIWLYGLSGSGKSTIAKHLQLFLHNKGHLTKILDGDNLRSGLNKDLGFNPEDRFQNIRRVAEVAKLFANCGIITICSFITPNEKIRRMAKNIIGTKWHEIFIDTPLSVCEERDVKGLYKKARNGEIKDFTGVYTEFEKPKSPNLVVETKNVSVSDCVEKIYINIKKLIAI